METNTLPRPPRVGLVSLGCPKALVDSERIITKLRADGYQMSPDYAGAEPFLRRTPQAGPIAVTAAGLYRNFGEDIP